MMDRVMNWQGLDFMTQDSGVNPLIASYVGAPYQIRGVDPAEFGRATLDYWQQNGATIGGATAAAVTGPVASAVADSGASIWDKVKSGFFGGILGIVVVALGLALIIWGRD